SRNKKFCVREANHILCVSESTKADLMRLFDVPVEKISVTYHGFSSAFACGNDHSVRARATERPYLLYVGHRGGYKNFANALRAYAASRRLTSEFDFIAFGGAAFGREEEALRRRLNLPEHSVRRLTGSDVELANAYRGARAFFFPSLYEGFGIPPLEA